jgi:hypothetical protein
MLQYRKLCVLFLALLVGATAAVAQPTEKNFNLKRTVADSLRFDEDEELFMEVSTPGIKPGQLEMTITLGFLDLNTTLLANSQLIYKVTDEAVWWGDVALIGQSAFNPTVRINYNINKWLAIEPMFTVSVSEYEAEITNRHKLGLEADAQVEDDPPLDEFDPERRSIITIGGGINAIFYPFNVRGDGEGRWHPYILGGLGRTWFDLNSNYIARAAPSTNLALGGGMRFIADDLISLRLDIVYNTADVQFDAAESFDEFNEGTVRIPVYDFTTGQEVQVYQFESRRISSLSWGIGFVATF